MDHIDEAIISILPVYVNAILAGTKTVELRRKIPNIRPSTRLWIYATKPVGAILCSAVVESIIEGTPEDIWNVSVGRTAVSRREFDEYFSGTSRAVALTLVDVVKRHEIGIEELRTLIKKFHPPQVLARLSRQDVAWLSERAKVLA